MEKEGYESGGIEEERITSKTKQRRSQREGIDVVIPTRIYLPIPRGGREKKGQ